jgi:HAE1 family hydrophobic/amphiphilic exporter-1
VKANFEAVQATREARVFAEAALDAEQKKFEAGKSTSFLVLEKQNDLTAARGAEIRALANYNQSLVDAAYEDGTLLQKNKVTVNVK